MFRLATKLTHELFRLGAKLTHELFWLAARDWVGEGFAVAAGQERG